MAGSGQTGTRNDETLNDWLNQRGKELDETYGLAALGIEPDTHCPTGIKRLDDAGLLELGVATIVLGHEGDGKALWVFSSSKAAHGAATMLSDSGLKIQGVLYQTGSTHPLWGRVPPGFGVLGSMTYKEFLLGSVRLANPPESGPAESGLTTADYPGSKPSQNLNDAGQTSIA